MKDWTGTRVLILGAARWLARHGARVTLNDLRTHDDMHATQAVLSDVDVEWVLGSHPLELLKRVDLLCPSGGIPLSLPIVTEALIRGIPLSNDTQIFLEATPCKTIGITGSAGKTTTTTLVGEMAKLAFTETVNRGLKTETSTTHRPPSAFIGGNIGDPLINYVDEMQTDDLAILEISSFQLDQMSVSTNVATILNLTPNHLDRHGTMEAYTAAKARLLDFQSSDGIAVLGRDDAGSWGLRDRVHGKLLGFSLHPLDEGLDGAYLDDGLLALRDGFAYVPLLTHDHIHLRGDHNVSNVLAAFAIGHAADLPLDAMLTAAEEFRGVPHRLGLDCHRPRADDGRHPRLRRANRAPAGRPRQEPALERLGGPCPPARGARDPLRRGSRKNRSRAPPPVRADAHPGPLRWIARGGRESRTGGRVRAGRPAFAGRNQFRRIY
jgi:UDP-N-acetylmuramoylalanine--D-glutamate ligase